MISVFGGTGFLGTEFCRSTDLLHVRIPREVRQPASKELLYLISTTDNYNVHSDPHKDVGTNLTVLLEVLSRCEPGTVINFVSSWFVYGDGILPAREESPCNPKGFYSITKRTAEQLLISYCETKGLNYRIFRMSNLYGPGDRTCSQKKNAMQWLVREVCEGRDVSLYHGGFVIRDYLHVTDAARALTLCMKHVPLNSITNVGTGLRYTLRNIIVYAMRLSRSKAKIIDREPTDFHRTVQVRDFSMNTDKLKFFGFRPEVTLKEGVKELCRLYEGK